MYADICQSACERRNLNADDNKSEMRFFKRAEVEMIDFATPYQARVPNGTGVVQILELRMVDGNSAV